MAPSLAGSLVPLSRLSDVRTAELEGAAHTLAAEPSPQTMAAAREMGWVEEDEIGQRYM